MWIFVGNLAYTTTAEELRRLFYGYGTLARVEIMQDREDPSLARLWLRRDARHHTGPGGD